MSASKKCSRAHSHLYEDSFRYLAYIYVQKSSSEAPPPACPVSRKS